MKYFAYGLDRSLSDRIQTVLRNENFINCASFQKLRNEEISEEDIILVKGNVDYKDRVDALAKKGYSVIALLPKYSSNEFYPDVITLSESFSPYELREALRKASSNANEEIASVLAGSSQIMKDVRDKILITSSSSLPVLITGETGTGKTMIAKIIHSLSCKNKEMITESCSCITENIAESELFGYVEGAFTNAKKERAGILATADGSSLFLDEIQDLPLSVQSMLLRVLDSGEFRKVGSDKTTRTSFRLISASNIPLESMIEEKKFRKDLFFRISGITIKMPRLEEHMEDIPEILTSYANHKGYIIDDIDLAIFMHSYPGNVRQLLYEAELYFQGLKN